jgi:hypothetical protein
MKTIKLSMLNECVCVCVCATNSNYNVRIIIQFLIKIRGTPETLWRYTSVPRHTGCGTLLYTVDAHELTLFKRDGHIL